MLQKITKNKLYVGRASIRDIAPKRMLPSDQDSEKKILITCNIRWVDLCLTCKTKPKNMANHITDVLLPISIIGSMGSSVYFFTKVITEYNLRKKMIEKGYVNEETQSIFKKHAVVDNRHASLKWGLLLLCGGSSLVAMEYLDISPNSPMPYGLFTASLSLGFLIYYALVRKDLKP